ncbi:cutinase [Xylariales sp. AK1849]|nr:cutinase [Xylariales sp. AK1849]
MKFSLSILSCALVPLAISTPIGVALANADLVDVDTHLVGRQSATTTANDFLDGGCKNVVLIYARATAQLGNIGAQPGPQLDNQLKVALGAANVAVQGVDYSAKVANNYLAGGCDATEAANMAALITQVANDCPSAKILVSGYSQGAAMVHASIKDTTAAVKARINAAVTFGDTQKQQDGGQIQGFAAAKTLILCNPGDRVCEGTLIVTEAHKNYISSVPTAVSFMVSKTG